MEYEIGSIADLISGLQTPDRPRPRTRLRALTPTKKPPSAPNTPQSDPPMRRAPRLVMDDSSPSSPSSRPEKSRKNKVANNFQFLSQIDDCEADLTETAERRAKLLKKGKDPEEVVREYYEDKNGIVNIEIKNGKNQTSEENAADLNEIKSDSPKKTKKGKKDKEKNPIEPPNSPYEDAIKNEIIERLNKLKNKNCNKENNMEESNDNTVEIKVNKIKPKIPSHDDELESNKINKKDKRKHEAEELTEDSALEKVIKKRMKKSTKNGVDETNDDAELDSTATNGDDESHLPYEDEEGESFLTDFQKSAKRRIESKLKKEKKFETDEIDRTLFIGNIPISILKLKYRKILKSKFLKYGAIESIRVRNIPVVDFKTKPMVALIENKFHPERSSVTAYIKFKEASSVEKALVENNSLIEGNHIRVDNCHSTKPKTDNRKTLFLGNLPFNVEEETVRNLFEKCGAIESVRIIRDKKTQIGKGFGFVNFVKADGIELALSYPEEDLKINNKIIRIKRYNTNPNLMRDNSNMDNQHLNRKNIDSRRSNGFRNEQTNKYTGKKRDAHGNKMRKRLITGDNIKNKHKQKAQNLNKEVQNDQSEEVKDVNESSSINDTEKNNSEAERKDNKKVDNNSYVGVMAKKKKKHKINKGVLKKKKMSKILMHNANTTK